jgi:hypothetical protein
MKREQVITNKKIRANKFISSVSVNDLLKNPIDLIGSEKTGNISS